jgi:hypothetical protein
LSEESGSRDNRAGVTGPVIELATIDERHRSSVLLRMFGVQTILRLGVDPVRVAPRVLKRAILIDRISPGSEGNRREETREIAWSGLSDHLEQCGEMARTLNEHDITEHAAIGVMFLLIHELEGAVSNGVLPIGSGGDYMVFLSDRSDPVQVEVSGIKSGSVGQALSRLEAKCGQIRGEGFVSVTTSRRGEDGAAHSYLHFVIPGRDAKKAGRGRRKGKGGK